MRPVTEFAQFLRDYDTIRTHPGVAEERKNEILTLLANEFLVRDHHRVVIQATYELVDKTTRPVREPDEVTQRKPKGKGKA